MTVEELLWWREKMLEARVQLQRSVTTGDEEQKSCYNTVQFYIYIN